MPKTLWSLALTGLALRASCALLAQVAPRSAFYCHVVDKSGGEIPGAAVTLQDKDTGATMRVQTNGNGRSGMPKIESGTYTIEFSLAGFRKLRYDAIHLAADRAYELRATLQPGDSKDIVLGVATEVLEGVLIDVVDVRDDARNLSGRTRVLVSGFLQDDHGHGVSSVSLVFNRIAPAVVTTVTSDSSGHWSVPLAAGGDYAVTISAAGFKTTKLEITFGESARYELKATLDRGDPAQVIRGIVASAFTIVSQPARAGRHTRAHPARTRVAGTIGRIGATRWNSMKREQREIGFRASPPVGG